MEVFGRGSISKLGLYLEKWGCSKILLITGRQSFDKSSKKHEIEIILKDFSVIRYNNIGVNPNIINIIKGVIVVSDFNPDIIIGIGGGSVLDAAKLLSVLPCDKDRIHEIISGTRRVSPRLRRLVLVPTTAGSGSEATQFAVTYRGKEKYSVASKFMLPDLAIIDPEFIETLPKQLRAISAFDAFSQAVESFWSVGATTESKQYASKSIGIIKKVFKDLIIKPTKSDWDSMMEASLLSGKAINITKTTAPHAISYALTQYFGIPHGQAVILTLAAVLEYNTKIPPEMLNNKLDSIEYTRRINDIFQALGVKNTDEAITKIHSMILLPGFKIGLHNYGINNKDDIELLAGKVNIERLSNNPIILGKKQLLEILRKSW